MRGFLLMVLAVLVAIAIGVAVESTASTPGLPAPVARAIVATMAVRNVEIRTSFPSLNSPAVYQAPDRWEGSASPPTSIGGGQSGSIHPVIIGDWEYETLAGSPRRQGVLAFLRPPPQHLSERLGLPPAQDVTFGPLIDARLGRDFRRRRNAWTFRDNLEVAGAFLSGGSITLAGGFVHRATIDEDEGGHRLVFGSTYSDINRAPLVPTPPTARTAG